MAKFFVLDLDMYSIDEWHREKVECESRSAQSAAEDYIRGCEGFDHDGAKGHIAVSPKADGDDAREYVVTLHIEYRCETRDGRDLTVPPPNAETEEP